MMETSHYKNVSQLIIHFTRPDWAVDVNIDCRFLTFRNYAYVVYLKNKTNNNNTDMRKSSLM